MARAHGIIWSRIIAALLLPIALMVAAGSARAEKRIALVVGNGAYQAGALATPANDAGLIAQTLQAAGFDVVGARDLDQDALRRAFRDFVEKAAGAGPDTVAFVYFSGHGLQLEGENYLVPVDARIARDVDVAAEALRVSDYLRPLAALGLKTSVIVLDAARANPFARTGRPLAGGLALVEPERGMLVAFNAAPGTLAPEGQGPYGAYAQALAEMIREGGTPLPQVFERTRLRVNDMTKGAAVPWHASKAETALVFFERAPDAPPPVVRPETTAAMRAKPLRDLPADQAYASALERDSLESYLDFVEAYPDDPMAARVRALIAARREAITWRRTRLADTPAAYWSYLQRYPEGPHAADAQRRLALLAAVPEPPAAFDPLPYDVAPPSPEEIPYVSRPVLAFDDPAYGFAPPPPPPVVFLAPPPPEFIVLPPPPPPVGLYALPCPVYRPVPVWVRPPMHVAHPPRNNVIFANLHNTVAINRATNTVLVTHRNGHSHTILPPGPGMGGVASPLSHGFGPALPPSVAHRAALTAPGGPPGVPSAHLGRPLPGHAGQPLPGNLPGDLGHPLPGVRGGPHAPHGASLPHAPPSAVLPSVPGRHGAISPAPSPAGAPGLAPLAKLPPAGARGSMPPGVPASPSFGRPPVAPQALPVPGSQVLPAPAVKSALPPVGASHTSPPSIHPRSPVPAPAGIAPLPPRPALPPAAPPVVRSLPLPPVHHPAGVAPRLPHAPPSPPPTAAARPMPPAHHPSSIAPQMIRPAAPPPPPQMAVARPVMPPPAPPQMAMPRPSSPPPVPPQMAVPRPMMPPPAPPQMAMPRPPSPPPAPPPQIAMPRPPAPAPGPPPQARPGGCPNGKAPPFCR